jgi:3-phosphoinositide dependent protein kinase-1
MVSLGTDLEMQFDNTFSGPSTPATSTQATRQMPPKPRLITELPPPSQLDIDWSPVLSKRDERILKLGNMFVTHHPPGHQIGGKEEPVEAPKKFSRFFTSSTVKKRQRLVMITSSGRVLMCAAGTNDKKLKEEVSLLSAGCAWRSYQDSKGLTAWLIETVCVFAHVYPFLLTNTLSAR